MGYLQILAQLYKELGNPRICVSVRIPGTNPPQISRDHHLSKLITGVGVEMGVWCLLLPF